MKLHQVVFATLTFLLSVGCQHQRPWINPSCLGDLPAGTGQAVVVTTADLPAPRAIIRLYQQETEGWQPVGSPMRAVVGRNGLAPAGEKREGDGRTPSGIFPLERGFGYQPFAAKVSYIMLTSDMIWIDDPRSPLYNTLTDKDHGHGVSYEIMRRGDDLYKYGIVIEYNTDPVEQGAGSAIFFHIWRNGATPTAGCVAAAETDISRILQWLDPVRHPMAVIGGTCR